MPPPNSLSAAQFEQVQSLYHKLSEWSVALGFEPKDLIAEIRQFIAAVDEGESTLRTTDDALFGRIVELLSAASHGLDRARVQEREAAKTLLIEYLAPGMGAITRNAVRAHAKKHDVSTALMQEVLGEMIALGQVVRRSDGKLVGRTVAVGPEVATPVHRDYPTHEMRWKKARASCIVRNDKFCILPGSLAIAEPTSSFTAANTRRRQALIESGVLAPHDTDPSLLRFVREIEFNSLSTAATMVAGTRINGRIAWKVSR